MVLKIAAKIKINERSVESNETATRMTGAAVHNVASAVTRKAAQHRSAPAQHHKWTRDVLLQRDPAQTLRQGTFCFAQTIL